MPRSEGAVYYREATLGGGAGPVVYTYAAPQYLQNPSNKMWAIHLYFTGILRGKVVNTAQDVGGVRWYTVKIPYRPDALSHRHDFITSLCKVKGCDMLHMSVWDEQHKNEKEERNRLRVSRVKLLWRSDDEGT